MWVCISMQYGHKETVINRYIRDRNKQQDLLRHQGRLTAVLSLTSQKNSKRARKKIHRFDILVAFQGVLYLIAMWRRQLLIGIPFSTIFISTVHGYTIR